MNDHDKEPDTIEGLMAKYPLMSRLEAAFLVALGKGEIQGDIIGYDYRTGRFDDPDME